MEGRREGTEGEKGGREGREGRKEGKEGRGGRKGRKEGREGEKVKENVPWGASASRGRGASAPWQRWRAPPSYSSRDGRSRR